jgi:hypothetical protein
MDLKMDLKMNSQMYLGASQTQEEEEVTNTKSDDPNYLGTWFLAWVFFIFATTITTLSIMFATHNDSISYALQTNPVFSMFLSFGIINIIAFNFVHVTFIRSTQTKRLLFCWLTNALSLLFWTGILVYPLRDKTNCVGNNSCHNVYTLVFVSCTGLTLIAYQHVLTGLPLLLVVALPTAGALWIGLYFSSLSLYAHYAEYIAAYIWIVLWAYEMFRSSY